MLLQQICCLLISKDSIRRSVASRCKRDLTYLRSKYNILRIWHHFEVISDTHFFFCACGYLLRLDVYLKLVRLLPSQPAIHRDLKPLKAASNPKCQLRKRSRNMLILDFVAEAVSQSRQVSLHLVSSHNAPLMRGSFPKSDYRLLA